MTPDVIIVGGGPVGLMTAALLDMAGIGVEVYERNTRPDTTSKATTMHPRTLEVLTQLEFPDGRRVSDVLVDQGRKARYTHFATLPSGLDYSGLDTPFPFILMIPQWQTEGILADYLRARSVPVQTGTEVTSVEQSAVSVRITAGGTTREAKYLIGADGAHSTVRHAAGIDFPGSTPTMVTFVADVMTAEPMEQTQYFWNRDAGLAGIMPLPGGVCRIFGVNAGDTGLTGGEARRRQDQPFTLEELRTSLKTICGTDFGVHDPSSLTRASNTTRYAQRYRDGRVLIVGDAAHVHLPAGGQGVNVGLQDAANLAWKLAAEIHGWAPDRLVDGPASYESERRLVAERLVSDTLAQEAVMDNFSPSGQALRDMFTGLINQGGDVARQLTGWLSGLAVGYPQPEGTNVLAGTRAPDRVLAGDGLLRTLRPDRFLLLDFAPDGAYADLGSPRVEVRPGRRHDGPWATVRAALIRPDGHVAHAIDSAETGAVTGMADAITDWTQPTPRAARLPES